MVKHNITIEDSSPLITYSGTWLDSPRTAPDYESYSGYATPDFNSFHNISRGWFDFAFNGSSIYVYGTIGPSGGPFDAVILQELTIGSPGGLLINEVKGSSSHTEKNYQSLLYSYHGLNPAATFQNNASSVYNLHIATGGSGDFVLDYIVVETDVGDENDSSSLVQSFTLDDTSSAFSYLSGNWNDTSTAVDTVTKYYQNGTEHYVSDIGAQVKINFRGSGIEVHGTWFLGGFLAKLDNLLTVPAGTPPTNNSAVGMYNRPRELLCAFDGLEEGNHTLTLTNTGGTAASSGFVGFQSLHIDYAIVSTTDPTNLDGLASTITLNSTSSNTDAPQPSASNVASTKSSSHTGAIVGGVVGGVAFLALLLLSIFVWVRYRRHRKRIQPLDSSPTTTDLLEDSVSVQPPPSSIQNSPSLGTSPMVSSSKTPVSLPSAVAAVATVAETPSANPIPSSSPSSTPAKDRARRRVSRKAPPPSPNSEARAAAAAGALSTTGATSTSPEVEVDAGVSLLRSEARATATSTLPPRYDPAWTNPPPPPSEGRGEV